MNTHDEMKAVHEGTSTGFEIAKKFFGWRHMSQADMYFRASNLIYLAKLIDEAFEKEKVE